MKGRFQQINPKQGRTGGALLLVALICMPGLLNASRHPVRSDLFVVGDYLQTEGGTWNIEQSPLRSPFGIDFDSTGAMYVIELTRGSLHRIPRSGAWETWREAHPPGYGGDGGPVSEAMFNGPHNCVVSAENTLLIADSWNHCVRSVDLKTRIVTTLVGTGAKGFSGDNGPAHAATLNFVMCIELDPGKKILHIADLNNRRVRNLDLASGHIRTMAGTGKRDAPAEGGVANVNPLMDPRAVTSDKNGNLYILERSGHALRVLRPDGSIHTVAGTGKKGFRDGAGRQAQFGGPKHMCCDPNGNVYIADDLNRAVRKYDPRTRTVSTVLGRGFGDPRVTLEHPHGVRWYAGSLYVVDTGHNRILRWAMTP